jgi:hypothetical protein
MHSDENLPCTNIDSCRAGLLYRPVAKAQSFISISLSGHADLSFVIRGSQAAKK